MTSCLCCLHSAIPAPRIWHVHPRCPVHGEMRYRGVPLHPGEYYGACPLDHAKAPGGPAA